MSTNKKVNVIACSGMGKVYGLMAREAVLYTIKHLCSEQAKTLCLAYIVTGEEEALAGFDHQPCITVDGCPAMCSAKSVAAMGGDIQEEMKVLDFVKLHKGAKPGTATELTPEGWTITEEIAAKIAERVQEIQKEGK